MRLSRLLPRYSLRTLLVFVMLAGCASALWLHREPWYLSGRLSWPPGLWARLPRSCSADGRRLVTQGEERMILWNTDTRRAVLELDGGRFGGFVREGRQFVVLTFERAVQLRDARDGSVLVAFGGVFGGLVSIDLSPDDRRVVIADGSSTARVLGAAEGTELGTLSGHDGKVKGAVFSPDGTRILTWASDGTARVWDAGSGAQLLVLGGHEHWLWRARFTPDGGRILTEDREKWRCWDAKTGKALFEAEFDFLIGFVAGGQLLVTWDFSVGSRVQTTSIRRADTGRPTLTLPIGRGSISPDGTEIAGVNDAGLPCICDAESGEIRRVFPAGAGGARHVGYSPDGERLLVRHEDGSISLWLVEPAAFALRPEARRVGLMLSRRSDRLLVAEQSRHDSSGTLAVYRRRRPERWWGVLYLREFWATALFAGVFVWSVVRDRRTIRSGAGKAGRSTRRSSGISATTG